MRAMRIGVFFCGLYFLTALFSECTAQQGTDAIEFTGGFGNIVRNHPDFPDINRKVYNGTLSYSRHYNGYKPWHRYYNFPVVGVSITEGISENREVFGTFTGVMAQMSFEKKLGHSFFWAPRLTFGAAYFSNPYNESGNTGNVIIGSEFTFLASADVVLGFEVSPSIDLISRVSLLHASNSHFALPNVGMNLPLVALGARYRFTNNVNTPKDSVALPTFKKMHLNFRVALGVNESGTSTKPVNGPKYPVYLASLTVSKMFSPVNKVTAGIEGWYNKGVYDFIVSQDFYKDSRHAKSVSVALVLGHEFLFGHWGFITTGGIYLYNPFYKDRLEANEITDLKSKLKSIIPARIGMQYYLKNTNFRESRNLFLGVYIKTNFGQADFFESGVGYVF